MSVSVFVVDAGSATSPINDTIAISGREQRQNAVVGERCRPAGQVVLAKLCERPLAGGAARRSAINHARNASSFCRQRGVQRILFEVLLTRPPQGILRPQAVSHGRSSRSPRRPASARVLMVPSGVFMRSATSRCESPPK